MLTLKRLAGIIQNLADPLTKETPLKPEITVKIEITVEAEIIAVTETQTEEITREINQDQDQEDEIILGTNLEIILETNPEIKIRELIEILVMKEIEKTIAKVVVIIVRIRNTTKIGVAALATLKIITLLTTERVDMTGATVETNIDPRNLRALVETFTKVTNSPV